jgi:hypothetical protein
MMADENVPATDSTDDELAAVAGVLYFASAELDDYGASVSEENGGRWGLPSWEWMRERLDRLEPARPVWEALSEGRVLLTPWLAAELRRFAADDVSAVEGFLTMLHEGFGEDNPSVGMQSLLARVEREVPA